MKQSFVILVISAVIAVTAHAKDLLLESAGTETGNGGGVVVCRNAANAIERAELLDFYEARVLRNLKLDLGDPEEDFSLKMEKVFSRLAKVSPLRTLKYRNIYNKFFSEAVIIPDAELTYIDDAANVVLPTGCKKEQASILRTPEFPDDPRYIISKILWDKLDNNSKAGLVLHEIMYQEGISIHHNNSKPTRYMVGKITSTQMNALTEDTFNDLILVAGFQTIEKFGSLVKKTDYGDSITYQTDQSSFFEDIAKPKVTIGNLIFGSSFYVNFRKTDSKVISAASVKEFVSSNMHASSDDMDLNFSSDGKLISISSRKGSSAAPPSSPVPPSGMQTDQAPTLILSVDYADLKLKLSGDDVELVLDENERPFSWNGYLQTQNLKGYVSPLLMSGRGNQDSRTIALDGVLLEGYSSSPQKLATAQGMLEFHDYNGLSIKTYFYSNGLVKSGLLMPNQIIELVDHRRKSYVVPINVEFRPDGLVIHTDNTVTNPDDIRDGCDINDYSVVAELIRPYLTKAINELNLFDWDPKTLNIVQIKNFVYKRNDNFKALPTFAASFSTKDGTVYNIDTYLDDTYGHQHSGGISMDEFADLVTKRNAAGQATGLYCEQKFLPYSYYNQKLSIVNDALNFIKDLSAEFPSLSEKR